jgi:hypothetical protein
MVPFMHAPSLPPAFLARPCVKCHPNPPSFMINGSIRHKETRFLFVALYSPELPAMLTLSVINARSLSWRAVAPSQAGSSDAFCHQTRFLL